MPKPLRTVATLCLAVAAIAASADPTVSLLTPDVTIVRPASGTLTYDFVGTVTATPGSTLSSYGFAYPSVENTGTMLDVAYGPHDYSGEASYSGVLFSVTVASDSAPGYYGFVPGSSIRSSYFVADGVGFSSTPFSITVQAVPEPASLLALTVGAAAFVRRRRRA